MNRSEYAANESLASSCAMRAAQAFYAIAPSTCVRPVRLSLVRRILNLF